MTSQDFIITVGLILNFIRQTNFISVLKFRKITTLPFELFYNSRKRFIKGQFYSCFILDATKKNRFLSNFFENARKRDKIHQYKS